jgi:hypothetical protein
MLRTIALSLIIAGILAAGCTAPAQPPANGTPGSTQTSFYMYGNGTFNVNGTLQQANGTLHVASMPPGADVYIDNEYRCPTDCALSYVITPGHHTVELRMSGYETVAYPVTVEKGGMEGINITLVKTDNLTVTSVITMSPP